MPKFLQSRVFLVKVNGNVLVARRKIRTEIANKTKITIAMRWQQFWETLNKSNFRANVCEGGARVPYYHCYRGGYGIIQWTTPGRYNGLGYFADNYGCDQSTLECQTRYMINGIYSNVTCLSLRRW